MSRVVMLMFKYIFDPALTEKLPGIFALMRELMEKETGLQHLETVLRYLFNTADMSAEGIKKMAEQSLSEKEGEFIMTLAERLHREGHEEGQQKGEQKGILRNSRESVSDILELRFAMVPESLLVMINTIDDISILKILHKKAVTVRSLDEFETMVDLILK